MSKISIVCYGKLKFEIWIREVILKDLHSLSSIIIFTNLSQLKTKLRLSDIADLSIFNIRVRVLLSLFLIKIGINQFSNKFADVKFAITINLCLNNTFPLPNKKTDSLFSILSMIIIDSIMDFYLY